MNQGGNGWREGRDPVQRWLRILATTVCLVVFAWLALDPSRRDWPTLTIALGAVLVLLGYEAIVRLPYLGKSDNPPGQMPNQTSYQPTIYPPYQQYPPVEPTYDTGDFLPEREDNVIVTGDNPPPPGEMP